MWKDAVIQRVLLIQVGYVLQIEMMNLLQVRRNKMSLFNFLHSWGEKRTLQLHVDICFGLLLGYQKMYWLEMFHVHTYHCPFPL